MTGWKLGSIRRFISKFCSESPLSGVQKRNPAQKDLFRTFWTKSYSATLLSGKYSLDVFLSKKILIRGLFVYFLNKRDLQRAFSQQQGPLVCMCIFFNKYFQKSFCRRKYSLMPFLLKFQKKPLLPWELFNGKALQ